jgi:hypothetical protein
MESAARDRLLRRMRVARLAAGLGATGLTAAFSVAAAHAFKGHDGHAKVHPLRERTPSARALVSVPAPENVPSIAADGSLQPPDQAPQNALPPEPQQVPDQQAPPVSGGS